VHDECRACACFEEGAAVTGERFIPFRRTSIITMCADEVPAEGRESFQAFAELLASLLHHEFRARLEALKDAYYPFNPERLWRGRGEGVDEGTPAAVGWAGAVHSGRTSSHSSARSPR
jgi:hypothetical protein